MIDPNVTSVHAKSYRRKSRVFTLIELLVAVSIVALLIAMLLPALKNAKENSRITLCPATCLSNCAADAGTSLTSTWTPKQGNENPYNGA